MNSSKEIVWHVRSSGVQPFEVVAELERLLEEVVSRDVRRSIAGGFAPGDTDGVGDIPWGMMAGEHEWTD